MTKTEVDPCAEQREDQIEANCSAYDCMVARDGEVLPGMDQSRLFQQLMGSGSQHPDRMKQVADVLLKCPPKPSNGRLTKKVWYDANGDVTTDADEACRIEEFALKGDDDSCPTSHIGIDIVDIVNGMHSAAARSTLMGRVLPKPEVEEGQDPECFRLSVVGTEQVEWCLPPEYHPDWDSLTDTEKCLTDACFVRMLTADSPLNPPLDDEGNPTPLVLPPVTAPIWGWEYTGILDKPETPEECDFLVEAYDPETKALRGLVRKSDHCWESATPLQNQPIVFDFPTTPGTDETKIIKLDFANLTDVNGDPVPAPGPCDNAVILDVQSSNSYNTEQAGLTIYSGAATVANGKGGQSYASAVSNVGSFTEVHDIDGTEVDTNTNSTAASVPMEGTEVDIVCSFFYQNADQPGAANCVVTFLGYDRVKC